MLIDSVLIESVFYICSIITVHRFETYENFLPNFSIAFYNCIIYSNNYANTRKSLVGMSEVESGNTAETVFSKDVYMLLARNHCSDYQ